MAVYPQTTQPTRPRNRRNYAKFVPLWLLLPSILVLLVLQVAPTFYSVWLSTTRVRRGVQTDAGLRNYERLLESPSFAESLRITLLYASIYVIVTLCLGLFIALLVNRRIRFTSVYLIILFVPWVLSDVVAGTMWRWLFQPTYGILQFWLDANMPFVGQSLYTSNWGALFIVILAAIWRGLPFTIILSLGALQTVPNDIIESAALDGANRFTNFWKIIFPMIRQMLLVMLLLTSIQAINSLGLIASITKGGPGGATATIAYYLYRTAWAEGDFGSGAAISVIMFAINVVLTLIYIVVIGQRKEQR
jgi:ABC-type sugar transport system permease subunit